MKTREKKFRAWDKEEKRWHQAQLIGMITKIEDKRFELVDYIGLKDKNGKEIYEGDILKYPKGIFFVHSETIGMVYYRDGCFVCTCSEYANSILYLDEAEVIGNIFENPELMKR